MYIKHWFDKFKNLYTFIQIILSESFFNRIFLIGLRAQYNKPITLRSKKKNEDFFHQTYAFGRNDTHIILNGTLAKWRISHQESTNRVKNLLDRSVEGEMLHCCSAWQGIVWDIPHVRPQVSVRNDIIVILRREAPKNLKQIAEDSSYSFGMTSGQKGERFLAYARNDKRVVLLKDFYLKKPGEQNCSPGK